MPISASARAGVAALAIAAAALPAIGQDRPESILPPGFGDSQPAPRPTATPGTPQPAPSGLVTVQPLPTESASPTPTPSATPTPLDTKQLAEYELPAFARRSLANVGPIGTAEGGLAADAFGRADGRYLEGLMRSLAAPLPSRWMSILLRRTLASQVDTPADVNGADFAAERAWLLLRMGEAVTARAVVQGVDNRKYTAKLLQVAMNAELATGDPAGLCPLQPAGAATTHERGWLVAQPICSALAGNASAAKAQMAALRRRGIASGIDMRLAQKVAGAAPGGGQAVTIEWADADRLTVWRYGLAVATGVAVPDDMLASTGRQVTYWYALAPGIGLADRIGAAEAAAAQGVLSNAAMVDLYGAVDAADDMPAQPSAAAQDLRLAYTAADADARLAAMRELWGKGTPPYARLVLTARAAARLPARGGVDDAASLVASMLAGGYDRSAARWLGSVSSGSDAWAMIVLADPDRAAPLAYRDLASYAGQGDAAFKQRLLFAGLAGLGRLSSADIQKAAEALEVRIGNENDWTRALTRAVADREPGTVVLLAAIGMQTPGWRGVSPEALYRIVAALRAVGLEGEARMIAAEAIARV